MGSDVKDANEDGLGAIMNCEHLTVSGSRVATDKTPGFTRSRVYLLRIKL